MTESKHEEQPRCICDGMVAPNAICVHVTVFDSKCSADDDVYCEYREVNTSDPT